MRNRNLTMGEMAHFMAQQGYGNVEFARKGKKGKRGKSRRAGAGAKLRNVAITTGGLAGLTYLGNKAYSGGKNYMSKRAARRAGAKRAGTNMSTVSQQKLLAPSAMYSPNSLVNSAGNRVRRK